MTGGEDAATFAAHGVLLDRSMPGGSTDKIVGALRRLLPLSAAELLAFVASI